MASGGLTDVWLTPRQWDVVLEALGKRHTVAAKTVGLRIWSHLAKSPGYQRHWHQTDARLAAQFDGDDRA